MATVIITIDTEENTLSANVDGKEIGGVSSASAYLYNDYYNKNKPKVSWNVSASNDTGDDDFSSYTNYCSASVSQTGGGNVNIQLNGSRVVASIREGLDKETLEKAKAGVEEYFNKKRGS